MTILGKDKGEIPRIGNRTAVKKSMDFKYAVSEGSNIVLNANDFLQANHINTNNSYSWKQTEGTPIANYIPRENSTLSFTAPYVKGKGANTSLSFELTIKDNGGTTRDPLYNANVIVKRVQIVIIFQGGVALGAYESGAYQAIVEKLVKNDEDKKQKRSRTRKQTFV